jgi:large subunit ribosomal protein L24
MSIAKIQTGDLVKVIAGKFKGSTGNVLSIIKKDYYGGKVRKFVTVSGVDKIVKFRKKINYEGQQMPGQLLQKDRKIDVSNVSLVDDKGTISKSKVEILDGKKQRIYKKTGKTVLKDTPTKEKKLQLEEKKETKTATKEKKVTKAKTAKAE